MRKNNNVCLSILLLRYAVSLSLSLTHTHTHTVKPDIKRALNLLEDLVSSVAYERSKCKSILFKALSPTVEFITTLFPVFLQQADVLEQLMGFFLTLFCSLKVQVKKTAATTKND